MNALCNRVLIQAVCRGQACQNPIVQLAVHSLQSACHVRLMNSQEPADLPEFQTVLITPKQQQTLSCFQLAAGTLNCIRKARSITFYANDTVDAYHNSFWNFVCNFIGTGICFGSSGICNSICQDHP